MANSLKEESYNLKAIALKASIKLDRGQLFVGDYFNDLFKQIYKINKKKKFNL